MSGQFRNDQPPAGGFPTETHPVVAGYEVLGEVACGPTGVAYQARQLDGDRPVVLELSPAGRTASTSELRRFHKEAKAAAKLAYPNIVSIYEAGEYQGRPYLIRSLVDGGPFAAHLPRLVQDQ